MSRPSLVASGILLVIGITMLVTAWPGLVPGPGKAPTLLQVGEYAVFAGCVFGIAGLWIQNEKGPPRP